MRPRFGKSTLRQSYKRWEINRPCSSTSCEMGLQLGIEEDRNDISIGHMKRDIMMM